VDKQGVTAFIVSTDETPRLGFVAIPFSAFNRDDTEYLRNLPQFEPDSLVATSVSLRGKVCHRSSRCWVER